MKKNMNVFAFLASLFLLVNISLALPCAFFGEVKLDGALTNGTYVAAYYTNGTFISQGVEPSAGFGHYSIAVNAPGENIMLKIKGIAIDQGTQFCENGEPNYLDISASTPAVTTTTTPGSSGGDGSSSSGGSAATTTTIATTTTLPSGGGVTTTTVCQEKWKCSAWSACRDGIETRLCYDENMCGTDLNKPFESQPCSVQEAPSANSITALLIGALSDPLTVAIIIILIAIILYILWKITKQKKTRAGYNYSKDKKK